MIPAELLAEALFCSPLQPSEHPSAGAVSAAVSAAVIRHGSCGCAELVAQEFGDHPDTALARMCWCRREVEAAYAEAVAQ